MQQGKQLVREFELPDDTLPHETEIEVREFNAPILPPGSSASGFFYYDTGTEQSPTAGASVYLTGLRNLATGRELFYFEIPLDKYR